MNLLKQENLNGNGDFTCLKVISNTASFIISFLQIFIIFIFFNFIIETLKKSLMESSQKIIKENIYTLVIFEFKLNLNMFL